MYENSDSQRTITTHPVEYLWAAEFIQDVIEGIEETTVQLSTELNPDTLTADDDSSVLFWGQELELYNQTLIDHELRIERAMTRFRKLLEEEEATVEDVNVKNDLVMAWARATSVFLSRVTVFEKIRTRALEAPTKGDSLAVESLGGQEALNPKDFECQEFINYIITINNIKLPKYLEQLVNQ